jgi:putative PEP-CTERM system histidine kinase
VSHGVVYSSITLLAVGIYLIASSLAITWASTHGRPDFPLETLLFLLSLLGLAVVLLWTDLRHRVKLWIRRNLLAGGYDYRAYWLEASERIQSVDRHDAAAAPVAEIVQRALGAVDVSVWQRLGNPNRLRLAAARSGVEHLLPQEVTGVLERFIDAQEPVSADEIRQSGANTQVQDFLEQTVASIIVPLQSSGRLTGLLCVGGDRSGKPYGWEAREFLGVLGRHTAAEFHKADLLSSLVQARESEAFRSFSTFLLHDLKNFASTLSLIARNSEKHRENPEFQRDAFRSVYDTAEKMKRLCNNLRAFSGKPELDRKAGDINHVVRETADNLRGEMGDRLRLELEEVPSVMFDEEEMSRVVQNLLLNARQAIGAHGSVTIRTRSLDGQVELSVHDDGCGMAQEYLEKSLFQPFRTTKSDGLGIGLFQCKKIVDAHKGTISVESEVGKGTIVRVMLPG